MKIQMAARNGVTFEFKNTSVVTFYKCTKDSFSFESKQDKQFRYWWKTHAKNSITISPWNCVVKFAELSLRIQNGIWGDGNRSVFVEYARTNTNDKVNTSTEWASAKVGEREKERDRQTDRKRDGDEIWKTAGTTMMMIRWGWIWLVFWENLNFMFSVFLKVRFRFELKFVCRTTYVCRNLRGGSRCLANVFCRWSICNDEKANFTYPRNNATTHTPS